jgi:hypothetical protein
MYTAEDFFAEVEAEEAQKEEALSASEKTQKESDALIDELVANGGEASDTYLFKAGMSKEQTILGHAANLVGSTWEWINDDDGREWDQVLLDDRSKREQAFLDEHPMIKASPELMDSGSFTAGRVTTALLDPIGFLIPVGKGGTLAKLAYNTAYGATDATLRSYSEQGKFDKDWALIGGAFGAGTALASPLVGKMAKKWGKNSIQAKKAALDTLEHEGLGAVEQSIIKNAAKNNPRIKELRDKWNSFSTNTAEIASYNEELGKAATLLKNKTISGKEAGKLKFKALQGLANELQSKAAVADEMYVTLLEELSKKATITDKTVDAIHKGFMLSTRPLFGGLLGGTAAAIVTNDDEAIAYTIAAGVALGAFHKRIQSSQHIPTEVKKNLFNKTKKHVSVGLAPRLKIATAATLHTKLAAYGGPLKSFADSFFTPMYREPGKVPKFSIEARADTMKISFLNAYEDAVEGTSYANREAAVDILRGIKGKYSQEAVDIATEIKAHLNNIKEYAQEVGVVLPEEIGFYVPRIWDKQKMAENQLDVVDKLEKYLLKHGESKNTSKAALREEAVKLFNSIMGKEDVKSKLLKDARSISDIDEAFASLPVLKHLEETRKIKGSPEVEEMFKPYLVNDLSAIMGSHIDDTVRSVEFSRTFGVKGEGLKAYRSLIHEKYNTVRTKAEKNDVAIGKGQPLPEEMQEISLMYDSINAYYGKYGKIRSDATGKAVATLTLLANLKYLPTVAIANLMDLAQPLQNSGSWKAVMKGLSRTSLYSKGEKNRFGMSVGEQRAIEQEIRAESSMNHLPGDWYSRQLLRTNQWFFKMTMLPKVTSLGRRFAYNTGMETTHDFSKKLVALQANTKLSSKTKKAKQLQLLRKLNHNGVNSDMAMKIGSYNTVDDVLKSGGDAKMLLEQAGFKAAERDSKIPRVGNRLLFTQTRDPLIRTLGLYTSWAQAKSAQVNALLSKVEDGDTAQLIRMLGMIPLAAAANEMRYYLINGKDSKSLEAENWDRVVAKGNVFSGNPGWIMASAMNVGYMDTPLELAVTGNIANDLFKAGKDIADDDWNKAFKDLFGDAMIRKIIKGWGPGGDEQSLPGREWNNDEEAMLSTSKEIKSVSDIAESNMKYLQEGIPR